MKPQNIKEFKELIERYESITIDEIEAVYYESKDWGTYGKFVANKLTGYGCSDTCRLCQAVDDDCTNCVFGPKTEYCCLGDGRELYLKIYSAKNAGELLDAFSVCAAAMREFAKERGIEL